MAKILIAFFSATGCTKIAAENIAASVQGDLFEIVPDKPYTTDDLNWINKSSRSSLEMKDPSSRPAIKKPLPDINLYDVIFLGFPIWWDEAPHVVATFIESLNFAGKTVIPFATSGGSGITHAQKVLEQICPKAKFLPGKIVNSTNVSSWARSFIKN